MPWAVQVQQRQTKIRQLHPPFGDGPDRLYTKDGRIVCTLTDKNARRQAREYSKKQPIYPKKQRVSTEWSGDAVGNPCPQTAMDNSSNRCGAIRPAPFVTFRWHIGKESRADFELELLIARARVGGRRPPNAGI